MSIYGPRIRFPKIKLPEFDLPTMKIPHIDGKKASLIIIAIILIATILFSINIINNLSSPINVQWKNNPLYLSESSNFSELILTITNNTKNTTDIRLNVSSESKEIIIFCPEANFPNVAPNSYRQTTCIIRRNPNERIFTGTYEIIIFTNIGKTRTFIEIRK